MLVKHFDSLYLKGQEHRLQMIAKVLTPGNLTLARAKVVANKGSAGIDGMTPDELTAYIRAHRSAVVSQIISREYRVSAIKGVTIPKGNGKPRLLGIPTVVDRWLQQAVSQQLAVHFELNF